MAKWKIGGSIADGSKGDRIVWPEGKYLAKITEIVSYPKDFDDDSVEDEKKKLIFKMSMIKADNKKAKKLMDAGAEFEHHCPITGALLWKLYKLAVAVGAPVETDSVRDKDYVGKKLVLELAVGEWKNKQGSVSDINNVTDMRPAATWEDDSDEDDNEEEEMPRKPSKKDESDDNEKPRKPTKKPSKKVDEDEDEKPRKPNKPKVDDDDDDDDDEDLDL